jgi:hypothetical protein
MRSPSAPTFQRVLHAHHVASAFQTLQTLQMLGMVAVWHPRSVNAAHGAPTQPSVPHAFFFRDGTSRLVDLIFHELDITHEDVKDRHVDVVGDQLSNARVRSIQHLRVRDYAKYRMQFASVKPGYFHVCLAILDAIFRCNHGRQDGRDPGSLARFVTVLGRSGVNERIPDFNACSRFILQLFDGYVLAAYITIANELSESSNQGTIRTVQDLKHWVEVNDWNELTILVGKRFFAMLKVNHNREKAQAAAEAEYTQQRSTILQKKKQDRTPQEIEFTKKKGKDKFVKEHSLQQRDVIYENACLFMQQALIYKDFHDALRGGHSGRMEQGFKMAMVLFAGCGKSNYYQEVMEQQLDRLAVWTPEQAYLDLNNCVVNLSGRENAFMARDQYNEHINEMAVSGTNPRDSWQSLRFHMETLPRCMPLMQAVRNVVPIETGAAVLGTRHSSVNDFDDIVRIASLLVQDDILVNKAASGGRSSTGAGEIKAPVQESIDAMGQGSKVISEGKMLKKIIQHRSRPHFPDAPDTEALVVDSSGDDEGAEEDQDTEMGAV